MCGAEADAEADTEAGAVSSAGLVESNLPTWLFAEHASLPPGNSPDASPTHHQPIGIWPTPIRRRPFRRPLLPCPPHPAGPISLVSSRRPPARVRGRLQGSGPGGSIPTPDIQSSWLLQQLGPGQRDGRCRPRRRRVEI
ncbi:hypothetical protein CC85DRAFT_287755 [Cutaneotrichosporon oleaginosum]|uniref:Uncharacterized protein n=1 Tax=Cutaneotrichosporon oleaginosum TaxID=879819 RepID=A0A0J0XGP4_9TREE|nr:uncharacterized protein CC85DRAFT_287755 [Cutaneotrichosporon oleaginosum]KLT40231.1 hypothetical protein CC85DRAFT_287755 [Cutaneotrichosporon oleaginosum]TXT10479.1 hypothetical protein COLE_04413 [Cutaneotrichosporon oleaginosum]